MFEIKDLFEKQSIIGAKLEEIFESKSITKTEFCKEVGISRPTWDKILSGTIPSETNYKKHIAKVLDYLNLTPDMLLGNSHSVNNRVREIRSIMRISSGEISKNTGISLTRLKEIEAGEEATVAELRDIAFCLGTSVNCVLGRDVFSAQAAQLADTMYIHQETSNQRVGGFWGHIGILPAYGDEYLWYPITDVTRSEIYKTSEQEHIVVPCMNNKILLLNKKNIKNIVLLDDACDQPGFANWDYQVSCGEIPLVVYEALDDYYDYKDSLEDYFDKKVSSRLYDFLNKLVEKKGWDTDDIFDITTTTTIYYSDGRIENLNIEFETNKTITSYILDIYDFGDEVDFDRFLFLVDYSGAELMVNDDYISIIEMPLMTVENSILDNMDNFYR